VRLFRYKTPEEFARQRDETIANYYGYPAAEAHAAAKKAGWTPYSQNQETTTPNVEADAPVPPKAGPTTGHVAKVALGSPGAVPASTLPPHDFTKSAAGATQPNRQQSQVSMPENTANGAARKPPRQ
jgi:hypothetical protein